MFYGERFFVSSLWSLCRCFKQLCGAMGSSSSRKSSTDEAIRTWVPNLCFLMFFCCKGFHVTALSGPRSRLCKPCSKFSMGWCLRQIHLLMDLLLWQEVQLPLQEGNLLMQEMKHLLLQEKFFSGFARGAVRWHIFVNTVASIRSARLGGYECFVV